MRFKSYGAAVPPVFSVAQPVQTSAPTPASCPDFGVVTSSFVAAALRMPPLAFNIVTSIPALAVWIYAYKKKVSWWWLIGAGATGGLAAWGSRAQTLQQVATQFAPQPAAPFVQPGAE